jgi:MFS family permease
LAESSVPSAPIVPASLWQQLSSRELKQLIGALGDPSFRLFLGGAFLSNVGSWMQSIAQAWLVLQLTNSPFYLGLDGFANTIPIAVFALGGGVIADRFDRRKLLLATQWILLILALVLALLTQLKVVTVWEVILFSFCTGLTQSIAWPVYQAILANIVHREHLSNAIALNSTQFNLARMVGPVIGALALSTVGTAGCFYANAVSFLTVIYALWRMRQPVNRRPTGLERVSFLESIREGMGYMLAARSLLWLLVTMAVTTLLGVPLVTLLPVFARDILKIGASGFGILVGSFGVGAVIAGVLVALLGDFQGKGRFVVRSMFLFVVGMLGFSISRNLLVSVLCLVICGFSMVGYASVINTVIQGNVPDHLRGRAMSLFVFSFGGCMPFGNLLAGYLAKVFTAPTALIGQGLVLGCFALYIFFFHPEIRSEV